MTADSNSDDQIRAILSSVRTIALVGASANPARPSHDVMGFMRAHGYRVLPVNPGLAGQTILGEPVFGIREPIDMVDIFRNSEAAGAAVDEALAVGAPVIWLQLGVINQPAAERAIAAGAKIVMDRCPKIELRRLGMLG